MGCYRLGGSLKQGETRKMLVARSNMSEKILLRTRCKDHRGYATKQKDDKGKVGKRNKREKERKKLDSNIF